MIPKTLHYAWFGGHDLPELERSCIDGWAKVMPDYEICRWDESNFDVDRCAFAHDAYEQGKFAFVSDYARYVILREYGGIFLDTDVKVLRAYDPLLNQRGFCGYMQSNDCVAPGLVLAGEPNLSLFDEVIKRYESTAFQLPNGNARIIPITSPTILTSVLNEGYGFVPDGKLQEPFSGFTVYPAEYFDPLDSHSGSMNVTENTYSIHLYSGTWLSPAKKYRLEIRKKLAPKVGPKLSWFISSALSVLKYGKKAI